MSGFQDPFSGLFNLPCMLFFAWAGFLLICMAIIFVGFEDNGFLHRVENKLGIGHPDGEEENFDY